MDILTYINKMNRLYGNEPAPVRFNTQKYLQGGRVGFYQGKSLAHLAKKIKEEYLKGSSTIDLSKKYIKNFIPTKNKRSSTTLENLIESMKDPTSGSPVKITKTELKTRPELTGTTAQGLSPAKIILNNPKAKKEFIDFANTKGNTISDSMKKAGEIAKKYSPEGTKVSGYTSRTGFTDSGLRGLIKQRVQLGKQDLDPIVTARLTRVKKAVEQANLPKTEIESNSKAVKDLAASLNISVPKLLSDIHAIRRGRVGNFNKKLFGRFPAPGLTESILKEVGYSKKTLDTLKSVERAAFEISQGGTALEHGMAKAFVRKFNLPKKYYLTGERTTNYLNQFKTQHDSTLFRAAENHAKGNLTYKEYKDIVNRTKKLVADKTGGYQMGYVDFVDGKAVARTPQVSILEAEGPLGKNATGLSKFIKNAIYHNNLYDAYKANPNDPAFGTLRQEIKRQKKLGKYKFVREDELENSWNKIKNFKTKEDFIKYYNENPDDSFFQALATSAGMRGGAGKALIGGTASSILLGTALAAEELGEGQEVTKAESMVPEAAAGAGAVGLAYKYRKPIMRGIGKLAAMGAVPLELGFMGAEAEQGKSMSEVLASPFMLQGTARENRIRKIMGDDSYQKFLEYHRSEADPVFYGEGETTGKRLDPNLETLRSMAVARVQQEDDARKEATRQFNLRSDETMFKSGGKVDYDNYLPDVDKIDDDK